MKKKHSLWLVFWFFLLALGAGAGTWFLLNNGTAPQSQAARAPEPKTRPIPTALVKKAETTARREFPGKVQAFRRVDLSLSVPGVLRILNAEEGGKVKEGALLAQLDQRDFENAYDSAAARAQEARQHLKRVQKLRENKVASKAELDQAEAAFKTAEAEKRIRAKALEDSSLHAPFEGVVAHRYVENHEHVDAFIPLLSLQDIAGIEVVFQVPEKLVARKDPETFKALQVRFDADSDRWHPASLAEFSVESDPVTRTYAITAAVAPPEDIQVFPGMTAAVEVTFAEAGKGQDLALVPPEAVLADSDGRFYVWVVPEEEGLPRKVEVQPGRLTEGGLEILSGVKPGERVATAGIHQLTENQPVRPMREGREGLEG